MVSRISKLQSRSHIFTAIVAIVALLIISLGAASTFASPPATPPTQSYQANTNASLRLSGPSIYLGTTSTPTDTPTAIPCGLTTIFQEGFEDGTLGQFASSAPTCVPGGCGWVVTSTAHSGLFAAFAPAVSNISDQRLTTVNSIPIPTGYSQVFLDFVHNYDLEPALDGAVLEFSTDGGANFTDVLSTTNFLQGGYNATMFCCRNNPLSNRRAWSDLNPGWVETKVNLQPFAGQSIMFRFREGTDNLGCCQPGWHVDDVKIVLVNQQPPCPTLTTTPTITRTPTRTPPPSITPTTTPTPRTIVGHVVWQALPAQPNPLQQMPITMTLKLGTTEVNYPRQLTDSNGFFTVTTTLPPGTYNWRVKGNTYLATTGTLTLSGAPIIQVEMGLQRTGDLTGDNAINVQDFNPLKNNFGQSGGEPIGPTKISIGILGIFTTN